MLKFGLVKQPAEYQQELAERCVLLRKQLKYSQSELAKRSGVSLGSLKRFEQTGQISLESLLKLAQILNRISDFDAVFKQLENLKEIEKLFSKDL